MDEVTEVTNERILRVVLGKSGLDGHDRGVKVVARSLMEAGFEVIYLGIRVPIETIVETAEQEDADIIGISNLSAALPQQCRQVMDLLAAKGLDDMVVIAGGTVLPEDEAAMLAMGVGAVFGPGSSTADVATTCRTLAAQKRAVLSEGEN